MKQQHGSYDTKKYNKGIDSDTSKELMGIKDDGSHVDALNMRSLSMDGTNLAKKHIGGEETFYADYDSSRDVSLEGYKCMMTQHILGRIVEVWAHPTNTFDNPNPSKPSLVRVDGFVVLMSVDFPVYADRPLQYDKNEHVLGSEFYITDSFSSPMVFNVKDMIDHASITGDETYFSLFNINKYTINVASNLYKIQVINTVSSYGSAITIGSSSGLPVGQYAYSYRYTASDGNFSSLSPLSDVMPVIQYKKDFTNNYFPDQYSYSKLPDIENVSPYGIAFKLRYDNNANFANIQIIRHEWYDTSILDVKPISYIIHTEAIPSGMGILTFLDKANDITAMTPFTFDETNTDVTSIETAKAIRFYNKRLYLMNLKYSSKDLTGNHKVNLTDVSVFPTVQNIGKQGHSNVFSAASYKSYMRGEKYGLGVVYYDNNGAASYVAELNSNFQMPNRRHSADTNSIGTSYDGMVICSNTDNVIANTFEVFDTNHTVSKTGELTYDIANANAEDAVLHPVSPTDHTFEMGKPVVSVKKYDGVDRDYNPRGFGLDYLSLGVATKDIPIPDGYSGFSIVRTEPANRVIAQGLAFYDKTDKKAINVFFPDADGDKYNPLIKSNVLANPTSYQIQLVAPLGFFTEIYGYQIDEASELLNPSDVDLITYARVLRDNGEINPGYDIGDVTYSNWLSAASNNSATDGDAIYTVQSATAISKGPLNQEHLRLVLNSNIWRDVVDDEFIFSPLYVVNLIQDNSIPQDTTLEYFNTGHFQKKESLIGTAKQQTTSSYPLVSERWEDCIPEPYSGADITYNDYHNVDRFVWIEDANGNRKPWLNVVNYNISDITSILNDLTSYGYYQCSRFDDLGNKIKIYGIYSSGQTQEPETLMRNYTIYFSKLPVFSAFSNDLFFPKTGEKIYVIYDSKIPVRSFGGDVYVNENIWAVQDNPTRSDAYPIYGKFPYAEFKVAAGLNPVFDTSGSSPVYTTTDTVKFNTSDGPAYIRQLINMWTAETRTCLAFSFATGTNKADNHIFYPMKNYVPRPSFWDPGFAGRHIDANYFTQYGGEDYFWGWGGFKYTQTTNLNYSKTNNAKFFTSVPKLGFTEQTWYPNRIAWSEKREMYQQNTPSTRTFLPASKFDISDNTGEIKFAWSALGGDKGFNLYAFTETGVSLIIVDKRVINDINAQELFSGSTADGVISDIWINQYIGMNGEMWRSWAEYNNVLFFCNKTGVYAFSNNQIQNLSEDGFQEIYKNRVLPLVTDISKLSGIYDILHNEYIMTFETPSIDALPDELIPYYNVIPTSLVYGVNQKALQCRADYDYDKYLSMYNKLYGMKKGITYLLGVGNQLNGETMPSSVANASIGEPSKYLVDPLYASKEFIRIRVNSNHKPSKIYFYDDYESYLKDAYSSVVDSTALSYSIKDYGGYECYIPRKAVAPYLRQQGKVVLFKIVNEENEDFSVSATMVQFKELK